MQPGRESLYVILRGVLMMLSLLAAGYLLLHGYYFTAAALLLIFTLQLVESYNYIKQYFNKIDKVISSILYEGYSVDFQRSTENPALRNSINLYYKLKERESKAISQKVLYTQILNGLDSGLLILNLNKGEHDIILMNDYFKNYFSIPSYSKWSFLKKNIPEFCNLLEQRKFTEFKTSIDIQIDKGERQTFILQSLLTQIKGQQYYTVLIDSIQRVIYSKENEAWVNVMKVISHELMNSLAPIHALAQNMNEILQQDQFNEDDREDMHLSIQTIINRSNHLQDFVDRYRELTMLPSPRFQTVNLNNLIKSMLKNYQFLMQEREIEVAIEGKEQVVADVDPAQFEQVLINLFTNSIHALDQVEKKHIALNLYTNKSRIFLELSDSGPLIDPEIVPKIFLPFYTTRKNGAGIGLSLSKAIIEAHNGYLYYQVRDGRNCFVTVLLKKL